MCSRTWMSLWRNGSSASQIEVPRPTVTRITAHVMSVRIGNSTKDINAREVEPLVKAFG